jgi:hypothetical protein
MKKNNQIFLIVLLTGVLLAACGPECEPCPPVSTQAPIEPLPIEECFETPDYSPLEPEECEELGKAIADAVGISGVMTEAPFENFATRETGTGCLTTITGDGNDFTDFYDVFLTLKEVLESGRFGWREDIFLQADGPTGHVSGFRNFGKLCFLHAGWSPSEDADCPDDQPIGACDLAPEQKIYTIELNCAKEGNW